MVYQKSSRLTGKPVHGQLGLQCLASIWCKAIMADWACWWCPLNAPPPPTPPAGAGRPGPRNETEVPETGGTSISTPRPQRTNQANMTTSGLSQVASARRGREAGGPTHTLELIFCSEQGDLRA